ncbi:exonuclease domain-containing protein [Anaerorhabdus sp.]|uniref:exonuclease domain-containing protein n=1 Tax=Anaerorhabdus sp. TaxID=1872524 RepID=UPI002FC5F677
MKYSNQKVDDFVVIDIETTGLNSSVDKITEISAIKVVNNIPVDCFSELINPLVDISKKIEKITGINNEMVADKPTIDKIIPSFIDFIGNNLLVGHNLQFDLEFLNHHIEFNEKHKYTDTYRLARKYIKDIDSYKLSNLVDYFNIKHKPSHRGLDDCAATLILYDRIYKYIYENKIKEDSTSFSYKNELLDIKPTVNDIDTNSLFYQKTVCFTNEINNLSRYDACQFIVNKGGLINLSVTRNLNYLIIGNLQSYYSGITGKEKKAREYINKGINIQILTESEFLEIINE